MKSKKANASYSSKISKRNKRRRFFKMVGVLLVPIILIVGSVYVVRLDSLQITNIEIEGATTLNADDIKKNLSLQLAGAYLGILPHSSIFLVDEKDLKNSLTSKFSRIKEASISKSVSGVLRVKIAERNSVAVWCSGDYACYLLDSDGLLFARALQADMESKIVFRGILGGDPLLQKLGSDMEMGNYFEMIHIVDDAELQISALNIESTDKATLQTLVGDIIFNPNEADIAEVGENVLLLVETERYKNPNIKFEYIDARFGNKLFYKTK